MTDVPAWAAHAVYLTLGVALLLTVVRLLRGPSLPDRVIALDMSAYLTIGFSAMAALTTNHSGYITVALALGLFVFLGTIAFARYLERVHKTRQEQQARETPSTGEAPA